MKLYRFNTVVESDGTVHLSGLPPQVELEIIVLERTESTELQEEMQAWMSDVQERHPFVKMSKDEILEILRQTREEVANDKSRRSM